MEARARMRTIQCLALLLCGGVLLYLGLSDDSPFTITCGAVFLLYAMFMRFYVRRARYVMDELRREIDKVMKALDAEDAASAGSLAGKKPPRRGDRK